MAPPSHPPAGPERALVYVPADVHDPHDFASIAAPCLERIEACGYICQGIVRDWPIAHEMMASGQTDVVVVQTRRHLPRDRRPRVEPADDPITTPPPPRYCVTPVGPGGHRRRPRRLQ